MTPLTIIALAKKTGADRDAIAKWLDLEGLQPVKRVKRARYYDPAKAIPIIERMMRGKRKADPGKANIDPDTGLTWHQLKIKQEALERLRENETAEKLIDEEWMKRTEHREILTKLTNRLEQIPAKARSEAGLNEQQTAIVRRMLDEARSDAAVAVMKGKP